MISLLTDPVFMGTIAAIVGIALLALATAASPLIAVISQQLATSRKSTFYDKFAKQIASMGCTLGAIVLTGVAAATTQLMLKQPDILQGPTRLPLVIMLCCLVFSFGMLVIYTLSWRVLQKNKGLHRLLGLLATATIMLSFSMAAGLTRILLTEGHPLPVDAPLLQTLAALFTAPAGSLFWTSLTQAGISSVAATGMFGLAYLILRRNKDDFGRDYYKFALPYCARWAAVPALIQLPLPAYAFWKLVGKASHLSAFDPTMWCWSATFLLPLAAGSIWYVVTCSKTPLRHKIGIFSAIPLIILAATSQIAVMFFLLQKM